MSRIISFGCSFTFGTSLPDCIRGHRDDPPSQYAWPSVIGRTIRRPVKNFAVPGASNLEILYTIDRNQSYLKPNDRVFIMWSFLERTCVIDDNSVRQIGPWIDKPYAEKYYQFLHSDYHDKFVYPILIREADRILRSKVNQVFYLEVQPSNCFPLTLLPIDYDSVYDLTETVSSLHLGADGQHPGIIKHENLAKSILKHARSDLL